MRHPETDRGCSGWDHEQWPQRLRGLSGISQPLFNLQIGDFMIKDKKQKQNTFFVDPVTKAWILSGEQRTRIRAAEAAARRRRQSRALCIGLGV